MVSIERIKAAHESVRCVIAARGSNRKLALVLTKLEEAELWLRSYNDDVKEADANRG